MKIKKINISSHPVLKELEINFENNGKILNTTVFVGGNGTGKTSLLECIFNFFENSHSAHNVDLEFSEEEKKFFKKNKEWFSNSKDEIGAFLGLLHNYNQKIKEPDSDINICELKKPTKVFYLPTELNFHEQKINEKYYDKFQIPNFVKIDSYYIDNISTYLKKEFDYMQIKDLKSSGKKITEKLCKKVNDIFIDMDLDIRMVGRSATMEILPLFKNSFGEEFDINGLSSGEKQLFLRALSLKMLEADNSIILIDEPEISLHPKWQQKIIKVYQNIGKNNQLIISTHSPEIVSSVQSEQVFILKKNQEEKRIEVINGAEVGKTYGKTVGDVLRDVMGLTSQRNNEVQKEIDELQELINKNKYDNEEFKKRFSELENLLGQEDESIIIMDFSIARRKAKNDKSK